MTIANDIQQARALLATLGPLDERLPAPLRSAAVSAVFSRAEAAVAATAAAKAALASAVDEQTAALAALADLVQRVRATVRGVCGSDSLEYQSVGGTRRSERKRPVRAPKVGPA